MGSNGERTRTQTELEGGGPGAGGPRSALDRSYLAVFEESAQTIHPLPPEGEVVLGRGDDVEVRLREPRVSRAHAKVVVGAGGVTLVDLGSQNGTRVGGVRVTGSRRLVSGDVIEIGGSAIVFHARPERSPECADLGFDELCGRVAAEARRSSLTGRPFGVVAVGLDDGVERVVSGLGPLDAWTSAPSGLLLVLLAERSPDEIAAWVAELSDAGVDPRRVGVAVCPDDGVDADALLTGAQASIRWSDERARDGVSAATRVVALDEGQEVLLADPAMLRVYELIERLAASELPVLLHGETGTGKELAALALHRFSPRRAQRLVVLNCAALTETLVESELFGYVKGAFTGATSTKPGLLEVASGGTVLLDEVGELPLGTQAKLLRALGTKRICRVGDLEERPIDVRVVSATNRALDAEVEAGRFRSDLFYRLTGAVVWLPPLRNRPRELAALARRFLNAECERLGRRPMAISHAALEVLAREPWPGNVRELENVMEYCAAAFTDPVLEPWHLAERLRAELPERGEVPPGALERGGERRGGPEPGDAGRGAVERGPTAAPMPPSGRRIATAECSDSGTSADERPKFVPLDEEIRVLERRRIVEALAAADGNQRRAAVLLSMPLRTFATKLTQYGLRRSKNERDGG